MEGEAAGSVMCGSWIRRPDNVNLVVLARTPTPHSSSSSSSSSSAIEIFSFDPNTTSLSSSPLAMLDLQESDGDPITIAVHPSGDCFVCSTTNGGCKLFELHGQETHLKLSTKELPPLLDAGTQKCLAFSVDGSTFAAGGVDGHLRILEWPTLRLIVDEPRFGVLSFNID